MYFKAIIFYHFLGVVIVYHEWNHMEGLKVYFQLKIGQDVTINQWGWTLEKHTRNSVVRCKFSINVLIGNYILNSNSTFTAQNTYKLSLGTVLRTNVHETTHMHITQSLKISVSLFYSYILFLTKNGNIHLDHPPYSQDLAPNGFCLFPKFKLTLKRRRFATTEDIQNSMTKVLKIIPKVLWAMAASLG